MVERVIVLREVPFLHHSERECVGEREHDGRARRGRQIVRACFPLDADVENQVAQSRSGAMRPTRDENRSGAYLPQWWKQPQDLFGFAAVCEQNDDVSARHHPEVSVDRFSGMEEEAWRSGAAQGARELLCDVTRFPNACRNDASIAFEHPFRGCFKVAVKAIGKPQDFLRFLDQRRLEARQHGESIPNPPPQDADGMLRTVNMQARPEPVASAQAWLEAHEQELIEDTREILQIPSVEGEPEPNAPFGHSLREALDWALAKSESWGFRCRDVEGYAGHAEFGDAKPMVMALGHLDVVPVGTGWKHEPFGAEIDGEYLYARGAVDDKGPTVAAMYAARALKETGAPLPARLRIVFGCNEESGFKCVERYFQVEEPPTYGVAPDAGWPLVHGEKGIANLTVRIPKPKGPLQIVEIAAGSRPNIVPDDCQMRLSFSESHRSRVEEICANYWDENVSISVENGAVNVRAKGRAAHGSQPFLGDNAIVRALKVACDLAPPEDQALYQSIAAIGHMSGAGLGIHGNDTESGELTSNLALAETEGDAIAFTVNVRYPVTWSGEDLRRRCGAYMKKTIPGAELASMTDSAPLYFPLDREPVLSIVEAYRIETGDMESAPTTMGGGTYARAVPNTVSIGTGWPGDGPAHEHDERIKVSHLLKMSKIYAHILYRLAQISDRA